SKLLIKLLQKRSPKDWADRSSLEVSGSVGMGESALRITVSDLMSLGAKDHEDLARILHRLSVARGEVDPQFIDAEVLADGEEPLAVEDKIGEEIFNTLDAETQKQLMEIF